MNEPHVLHFIQSATIFRIEDLPAPLGPTIRLGTREECHGDVVEMSLSPMATGLDHLINKLRHVTPVRVVRAHARRTLLWYRSQRHQVGPRAPEASVILIWGENVGFRAFRAVWSIARIYASVVILKLLQFLNTTCISSSLK